MQFTSTTGTIRRMTHKLLTVIAIIATAIAVQAQQSPREMYERARLLEESPKRLPEAVALYREVVEKSVSDRALAASAQLRIGEIYEKQGRLEARAEFETVVKSFGDQIPIASVARTRLAALAGRAQAEAPAARLIRSTDGFFAAWVSDDGSLAVGFTSPAQEIAVQNLATGTPTTLVPALRRRGQGVSPIFSPDARRVAFSWHAFDMVTGTSDQIRPSLQIIDVSPGAAARTLIPSADAVFSVWPAGWSPDGSRILAVRARHDPAGATAQQLKLLGHDLMWVSATTGEISIIRTFEPGGTLASAAASRDGRFLAYSVVYGPGNSKVFVCDADGKNEQPAVTIAGMHSRVIWTPSGSHVLFSSTRSGSTALWAVAVQDGKPIGEPVLIKANAPSYLNMSSSGTLFFNENTRNLPTVYAIDRNGSSPRVVQTFHGQAISLSPDGKQIAFIRQGQPDNDLIVRTLATGSERLMRRKGLGAIRPQWLPDGTGLIVFVQAAGDDNRAGGSFYHVDMANGAFTRRFARNTDTETRSQASEISPDGRTLYLTARPTTQPARWTSVVGLDVESGTERVRLPLAGDGYPGQVGLTISPDGKELAIHTWVGTQPELQGTGPSQILAIRTDGTGSRKVAGPFTSDRTTSAVQWTPDGRSLLYYSQDENTGAWKLMRLPASGGAAVEDGLTSAKLNATSGVPRMVELVPAGLELSTDGSRLFTVNFAYPVVELWALDNILQLLR